jgi:hypothetical protein
MATKINLNENLHLFSLRTAVNLLRKISNLRLTKTVSSKWKFLYSLMLKKSVLYCTMCWHCGGRNSYCGKKIMNLSEVVW